ncbi:MAG: hypothetical protein U0790_23615 [Isosphaeraceae bacterium]
MQDLASYRNAPGTAPMPRILLLVDEFEEFFVEEDRLAQEAALLLDRLVRQGRAFGVHVLLGSQSLGGAFTLARSTLGQMAVRIALQCSEVDSLLILAENNLAAKWLSRPGEAIYNDTNGSPEGNHFFQVVWLPDEAREVYLKKLLERQRSHPPALSHAHRLRGRRARQSRAGTRCCKALVEAPAWPESPRSAHAWLGDPVAIKDPTSALVPPPEPPADRRPERGGRGSGVVSSSLVSLAASTPRRNQTACGIKREVLRARRHPGGSSPGRRWPGWLSALPAASRSAAGATPRGSWRPLPARWPAA